MAKGHHATDMSIDVTESGTPLTERVAEEIRGWMGKRRLSQAALARQLGVSKMWVSYRLSGAQPIDVNDLERIARALGVAVAELLPADIRRGAEPNIRNSPVTERPTDNRPPARPKSRGDRQVTKSSSVRRPRLIGSLRSMAPASAAA